jgi:hypothetical protein
MEVMKMTQGEQFKNLMEGPDAVHQALLRHFRDYDVPLKVTTAEGFTFEIGGIVGSLIKVNGDEDGVMTAALGAFDLQALMAAASQNDKAAKEAIAAFTKAHPRAAMAVALKMMMAKAEKESGGDGIGDLFSKQIKSGKNPLGPLAAMMAMMMDEVKPDTDDEIEKTGTDDPFK